VLTVFLKLKNFNFSVLQNNHFKISIYPPMLLCLGKSKDQIKNHLSFKNRAVVLFTSIFLPSDILKHQSPVKKSLPDFPGKSYNRISLLLISSFPHRGVGRNCFENG
jgi:hypothetical protein